MGAATAAAFAPHVSHNFGANGICLMLRRNAVHVPDP